MWWWQHVSSFFLFKKDVRYSPWIGLSTVSIFQTNFLFLGRNLSSHSFFASPLFQERCSVQPVVPVPSGWALPLCVPWDAGDTCLRMASLPAKHWTMTRWSSSRSGSGSRLQAATAWSSHWLWEQAGSRGWGCPNQWPEHSFYWSVRCVVHTGYTASRDAWRASSLCIKRPRVAFHGSAEKMKNPGVLKTL